MSMKGIHPQQQRALGAGGPRSLAEAVSLGYAGGRLCGPDYADGAAELRGSSWPQTEPPRESALRLTDVVIHKRTQLLRTGESQKV